MNKPLLPLQQHERPFRGKEVDSTQFTRLAVVSRVDYETGYVDLVWLEGQGTSPLVQVPLSHSSLRSSIRGMPEEGSIVICGWSRQTQTWEQPIILGFVDIDLESLIEYRLLRNSKTPDNLKDIKTIREKIGYNVARGKRRKIYPGEIQAESTQGSELYLDDDVYLSDSKLNEIEIRSADKSIRLSSNQIYSSTQASRSWNGMISRDPGDLQFSFQPTTLPNGQKIQFVTDSNNPIHLGGRAFTENRIELFELADGILKASEVNAGYDVSPLAPYMTFVMGTLVGNDKSDTAKYAKVLRPQIFGTPIASEFSLDYIECTPEESTTLASTLHFRHFSRAQIDIDKEGHLFTFFPESSGRHPLGPGRSWEAGFEGSVKFVVGAENIDNRSIFLDTKGGIRATIGYDKEGKSSYLIYQKGLHQEIMAPANDGAAYYLKTKGDYRSVVDGNYNLEVTGNYIVSVRGKVKVESLATREENFVNDKNNVYGGAYKKIVVKDKQEQIGYNRVTKITGNLERAPGLFTPALGTETSDKFELTTGTRTEKYWNGSLKRTFLLGDMTADLTKGNIEENIILGNRKLTIVTGNQEDKITSGDNKTEVTTGNIIEKIGVGNKELTITTGSQKDKITTGDNTTDVTTGNIKETISTGNRETKVTTGNIKETVTTGNKETKISTGSDKEVITTGNEELKITTGSIKETVTTGNRELKISTGSQKDSITTGNNELKVTTGNIKETVTTGSRELKVTTGNVKEDIKTGSSSEAIVTGSKSIKIKTGNYTVEITAGNIDIKTKVGKVKMSSTAQTVDVSGMLTVTVKSGVKLKLTGPQVEIGQLPTKGGVVTGVPGMFTTVDPITGTPPIGSKTVKASI
jgi:hypothetical protein